MSEKKSKKEDKKSEESDEEDEFEIDLTATNEEKLKQEVEETQEDIQENGKELNKLSRAVSNFEVLPDLQVLDNSGNVLSRALSTNKLQKAATTNSRELLQLLMEGKKQDSEIAKKTLLTLNNKFLPISKFKYERGKPSHAWKKIKSDTVYDIIIELCEEAIAVLKNEPNLLSIQGSPCYVLGDLHGNYKDLVQFSETFWKLGLALCPAKIVCLGDYVDRGPHSLETAIYLLAQKVLCPTKIYLLRGNHETREVNGDTGTYAKGSFRTQCHEFFGKQKGEDIWDAINNCFEQMPLAAIIDNKVFCVHGGIPRHIVKVNNKEQFTTDLNAQGKGLNKIEDNEFIMDLLWADPATEDEEEELENPPESESEPEKTFPPGWAHNEARGGDTTIFGDKAVESFCKKVGVTHIIRAHQPPSLGISFRKKARVVTVFSSSHYCGGYNSAAAVLLADKKIHIIVTNSQQTEAKTSTSSRSTRSSRKKKDEEEAEEEEEEEEEEENDDDEEEEEEDDDEEEEEEEEEKKENSRKRKKKSPVRFTLPEKKEKKTKKAAPKSRKKRKTA